jgi:hypothetical protein
MDITSSPVVYVKSDVSNLGWLKLPQAGKKLAGIFVGDLIQIKMCMVQFG